jgi:hypothetical protein
MKTITGAPTLQGLPQTDFFAGRKLFHKSLASIAGCDQISGGSYFGCPVFDIPLGILHVEIELGVLVRPDELGNNFLNARLFVHVVRNTVP